MQEVEKSVYESNRMLNTLISNLPGMVCRFKNDMDWTMEYMSDGCLELTGYSPEELVGNNTTSYGKITFNEDNINVWNVIQNAIFQGNRYHVEYRISAKNGELKWIWEQGIGVYDTNGFVIAIEAFMTDITKQKQTECNFHRNIEELKERNMELDTFTYRVSHDIRSPLLTIYGLTSLLRLEKDCTEIPLYCERIDATVKKLDIFTKDLLMYSRSKEYIEKPELINFNSLIEEALIDSGYPNYMDLVYFEMEINLNREIVSELFRLKVILSNLLANSIKYRDNSKQICCLKISISNTPSHYTIMVEDNGIGIAPEFHKEIFKMFFRATEASSGTGLGLYIVKMNVEKLNGSISYDGAEGLGSSFLLTFPLV